MTDKQIDEQEAEIDGLRRVVAQLTADKEKLLQALSLAEAVYRMNCVADGEPSSILDCLKAAIAEGKR